MAQVDHFYFFLVVILPVDIHCKLFVAGIAAIETFKCQLFHKTFHVIWDLGMTKKGFT